MFHQGFSEYICILQKYFVIKSSNYQTLVDTAFLSVLFLYEGHYNLAKRFCRIDLDGKILRFYTVWWSLKTNPPK